MTERTDLGPQKSTEAPLPDVCRCCLTKHDAMTSFFPKTDVTSDLIAMISSVGNFEVDLNEILPAHLCKICERQLTESFKFQQLIRKSNEIIKECLQEATIKAEDDNVQVKLEWVLEEEESKPIQTMRLPQFPAEEVERAIEESKAKFFENVKCIKCGFVSSNLRALSTHMTQLHREVKEKWCMDCNSEVDDLAEHSKTHEEELKCKFCKKICSNRGHFKEHLQCHSEVRPFHCAICPKTFISSRHLNKHLSIHYFCAKCKAYFRREDEYSSHTCEEQPEETIDFSPGNFCKICDKRVRSASKHFNKVHLGQAGNRKEKLLCTVCGKQFAASHKLRVHMRVHTGETPYKCSYCDKRMTSRNQVVVHERVHTGEKPHICGHCGKGFAQTSVLNTHLRIHTGRPHLCEICSKGFCRPAQLKLHMREHTGEKPYLCTQCGQTFKQKSHLVDHSSTHSEERPYICEHCPKSFKQKSSLKTHVLIHLDDKPFKCSQCPYACRQSYSLTQHMKQHSGDPPRPEKPYSCSICQKTFSTMAMVTSHEQMHQ